MTVSNIENGLKGSYFNKLPKVILGKILVDHPHKASQICKVFFTLLPSALYTHQWIPIKNDKKYPLEFRKRLQQIEDTSQIKDGRLLISKFFRSLYRSEDSKQLRNLDFSNLGNIMLKRWKADQTKQDDSLHKCWAEISLHLDPPAPLNSVQEIRVWMQDEKNQIKLSVIKTLDCTNFQLTHLPIEITIYFKGLKELIVRHNKLQNLPDNIGNLVGLEKLWLQWNPLQRFPESILRISRLKELNLRWTQLKSIPESIGKLCHLKNLSLDNNQLQSLPSSIGNLSALEKLDLEANKLHSLPETFAKFDKKLSCNLNLNKLLIIPQCVLEKFKETYFVKEFISLQNAKCTTSFDHLCQFIRQNSDSILKAEFEQKEKLGELVDTLEEWVRTSLYSEICGKKDSDYHWGEKNRFGDISLFISALGHLLRNKHKFWKHL